eukprot:GSChrysophyteH1.ASY1.ANO1.2644.1 assembled CDS
MCSFLSDELFKQADYVPPEWYRGTVQPSSKVNLARLPTPYHKWNINKEDNHLGLNMYIKRDDQTGFELGGNKVRKLQFLIAQALEQGCDTIVTIGGVQSNHCRATAAACRQMGITPYLILRTRGDCDGQTEMENSIVGNLLFDRMVGARIRTVTAAQYEEHGGHNLVAKLVDELNATGECKAFGIPIGGSCPQGAFGYIDCVEELRLQKERGLEFDHVVFGSGSGGTAAGLSIGGRLSGVIPSLHGVGVCDSPDVFYAHIEDTARSLGIDFNIHGNPREWITMYDGQGRGYGLSSEDELAFIQRISSTTGVCLDPVYSGKALYHFLHTVCKESEVFKRGQNVLFIHTGGALGLYDRPTELPRIIQSAQPQQIQPLSV